MKNTYLFILLLISIVFSACEEVIEVDLNSAPPKLVIEASIKWEKGTMGRDQVIYLSTTTDYFSDQLSGILGATVYIKNSSDRIFIFDQKLIPGEYACYNFRPVLDETYTLTVIHNGQTYTATETLIPVAPITKIIQNNNGGITQDKIEIKAFYNDPPNIDNYYLYKYMYSKNINSSYYTDKDIFFQGNEFFSLSQNDKIKVGDKIQVTHSGISKTYYNYLNVLISISGTGNGSPFQSPPATVRGNIINTTNFNNYALGYFTLSESNTQSYTIQ